MKKALATIAMMFLCVYLVGGCIILPAGSLEEEEASSVNNAEATTIVEADGEYTIDYNNAESFEKALNDGGKVKDQIVQLYVKEYHPDSALGINCHAGEHLNFIFEQNVDVEGGDTIVVRVTKEPSKVLGSWKVPCEFLDITKEGQEAKNDTEPEPTTDNAEDTDPESPETGDDKKDEEEPVALAFLYDFTEYGYDTEQIEAMRTLLLNVGITEITELEIGNVSYGMQVIKGLAFTTGELAAPQEVRVQFNIENGAIYLVAIYCPSYSTSNQPTYLSGLEDRRADLYYDVEGGYIKKIDWENKTLVDYE